MIIKAKVSLLKLNFMGLILNKFAITNKALKRPLFYLNIIVLLVFNPHPDKYSHPHIS